MIDLGPCEITGVFGPMASGKTYLISQWLKTQNRYVRFDATGESITDASVSHVWASNQELYLAMRQNPYYFRIAFHPGEDMQPQFIDACRSLARLDSFKLLVVDEFHEVCSVNETPKYVRTMLRYARHARIALIGASQRIADVHKLFTAGCRQTILFWTQEARDLGAIADRWGRDTADRVASLRPLIYDDTTKVTRQVPQCIVIPRGSRPRIYDFQTNGFLDSSDSGVQEGPQPVEEDSEDLQREGTQRAPGVESRDGSAPGGLE